jgi:ferritin
MNLFNLIFMLLGVVVGSMTTLIILFLIEQSRNKKIIESINSVFKEVLNNILSGQSKFISRINNIVNIEMSLSSEGKVNIMYWLNKNEVSIFKGDSCIYSSNNVDVNLILKISNSILGAYHKNINDTINILNTTFDKKTFSNLGDFEIDNPDQGEIEPSLDDLLDRINSVGYANLSDFEKKILKKYGNSK